jgi:hypothetical protein
MSLNNHSEDDAYNDWVFTFNLSTPIEYLGQINDSPNIKININNNHITGFTITIKDSLYDKAEEKSRNKAINLSYIITIKSTMPVEAYLKSYHSRIPKGNQQLSIVQKNTRNGFQIDGAISDLDLNDSLITDITNSAFPDNLSYEHLSKAIFHNYNNNPSDCIKEGFKIVANNPSFSDSFNEYKSLRDFFSHSQTPGHHYQRPTLDLFKTTFKDTLDYTLDYNSNRIEIDWKQKKNRDKLGSIADKFVRELKTYLKL